MNAETYLGEPERPVIQMPSFGHASIKFWPRLIPREFGSTRLGGMMKHTYVCHKFCACHNEKNVQLA